MDIERRPLNAGERAVLELLVDALPAAHPARAEIADAAVTGVCPCGECPSIELSPAVGLKSHEVSTVIVSATHQERGQILLFVDDGHLSYLEYAPFDLPVFFWPPVGEISDVRLGI